MLTETCQTGTCQATQTQEIVHQETPASAAVTPAQTDQPMECTAHQI